MLEYKWCGSCVLCSILWYGVLPDKGRGVRFEWATRCTETIHSLVVITGAVAWVCGALEEVEWLIRIMYGYLMFDTAYEIALPWAQGRPGPPDLAFTVHHVVGIALHVLTLETRHAVAKSYAPYIYLAELSTPFLHWSWMLNVSRKTESTLFFVNGIVGTLMYVVFRVLLPPALLVHAVATPGAWRAHAGYPQAYWCFVGALVCFVVLNWVWFGKLIELLRAKLSRRGG
ncbi:hypothetical protein CTAYLR_009922 [Chrysophaeum taylorii]|uniref:TLC domain-containing protein n=1 Tax=Chrysophaeum taylorii TaxID=2483200 RepID=A0AAD7XRH9_9STRA|nr:hypothetical protein CTAYLR_009922 [Chrysophaeum taylorii]